MAPKKKGPGRPRKPGTQTVLVSCSADLLKRLDRWRVAQRDPLSRPAALRWLADVALEVLEERKDEK
jgi:hypothetical protein